MVEVQKLRTFYDFCWPRATLCGDRARRSALAVAPCEFVLVSAEIVRVEAPAGLAVGLAGGAAYGLARGTGWVLENTLFRPQQGSEDAAVQDVRSANNMNDATQSQHFTLRSGSSTSGSPASSRASSQSFRVQAQAKHTPRPFSWGLNPVTLPQSQPGKLLQLRTVTPEPPASALRGAGKTSRRPRAVRVKMRVALHVKKHGGSHMQSLDYKLKTSNTNYVTARHDVQCFPSSLSSFSPATSRVCRTERVACCVQECVVCGASRRKSGHPESNQNPRNKHCRNRQGRNPAERLERRRALQKTLQLRRRAGQEKKSNDDNFQCLDASFTHVCKLVNCFGKFFPKLVFHFVLQA